MVSNWKTYWSNKNNRTVFIFSFAIIAIVLFYFLRFLIFTENRKGIVFNDPILNLFPPVDLSVIIFSITYPIASFGVVVALQKPELFLKLIQVYTILILLRMLTLYSVALEPPIAIIPLRDALLESTFYTGRKNLKDLFFSGHVSILFVFAFVFTNKKLKILFAFAAIIVGVLVLIQHVHYSIDVIAAPVFAYLAFIAQKKINFQ